MEIERCQDLNWNAAGSEAAERWLFLDDWHPVSWWGSQKLSCTAYSRAGWELLSLEKSLITLYRPVRKMLRLYAWNMQLNTCKRASISRRRVGRLARAIATRCGKCGFIQTTGGRTNWDKAQNPLRWYKHSPEVTKPKHPGDTRAPRCVLSSGWHKAALATALGHLPGIPPRTWTQGRLMLECSKSEISEWNLLSQKQTALFSSNGLH